MEQKNNQKNNSKNRFWRKYLAPRPGLEPGSKAPEASRMSATLPRLIFTVLCGTADFFTFDSFSSY